MKNCKYLFTVNCRSINIKIHECFVEGSVKYKYSFDCTLGNEDWEDIRLFDTVGAALDDAVIKAKGSWQNAIAYWESDPTIVED